MPDASSHSPPIHNILSWDGGPSPLLMLRILKHVEQHVYERTGKSFISRTDLFVGTSNGAFMSLFLASRLPCREEEGVKVLNDCIEYSNEILRSFQAHPLGIARMILGFWPLNRGKRLKQTLRNHLGTLTLGQLHKKILAIAYGVRKGIVLEMHNVSAEGHPNLQAVDVAMASSAFPVLLPTYKLSVENLGVLHTIDGGFAENNPTAAAINIVCRCMSGGEVTGGGWSHAEAWLKTARVLSVGTHYIPTEEDLLHLGLIPSVLNLLTKLGKTFRDDDGGWFQWLIAPPLRLPNIVLQASVGHSNTVCQQLLGSERYLRVEPRMAQGDILTGILFGNLDQVLKALDELARGFDPEPIINFICQNWLGEPLTKSPQSPTPAVREPRH